MRKALILTLAAAAVLTAGCSGSSGDSGAETPPFSVVSSDDSGNSRDVIVEVESTQDDEAGYHVLINCSSGGTAATDNRLANWRHAIGTMGAATTGLMDGDSDFSVNEGRSCPA